MMILVAMKLKLPIVDMDMLLSTIYRVDQVECEKPAPLGTNDHLSVNVYISTNMASILANLYCLSRLGPIMVISAKVSG